MRAQDASMFYHKVDKNANGTPQQWRRNGATKLWKRKPNEFKIPVKRGMYQYEYITHENIDQFTWS
jgi:hypothetical protein